MTEIRNSLNGVNSELEMAEDEISETEDRLVEFTQSKCRRENRLERRKKKQSQTWGTITTELTGMSPESQRERREWD